MRRTDVDDSILEDFVCKLRQFSKDDMKKDEGWRFGPVVYYRSTSAMRLISSKRRTLRVLSDYRKQSEHFGLIHRRLQDKTSQIFTATSLVLFGIFVEGERGMLTQTIKATRKLVDVTPVVYDSQKFIGDIVPDKVRKAFNCTVHARFPLWSWTSLHSM